MLKKTGVVVGLLGMFALSALLMSCGSGDSRPAGLLYVVSQSLANVSSYAIDLGSGDLSLISNNLMDTCPDTSCGLPLTMSLDPTGATAFVLNQQALTAFTVNSDGGLSKPTIAYGPFGQTAMAMASTAAGDLLFVITSPPAPSLDDEPQVLVFGTTPGSTTATLIGGTSLSRVPTDLSAITFAFNGGSPRTMLFVSSNLDLTDKHNDSELSVFSVDSGGNLTEQTASPYSAQAPNPLSVMAVNTNPPSQNTGGVYVYVGSQAAVAGSVSAFQVCTQVQGPCTQGDVDQGNLRVIGKPLTVGQNPIAMLADPTNTFLYIACNVGNNVYAFRMNTTTGLLTALSPGLQPTGAGPVALAMHGSNNNSDEYLFVSNNGQSTLSGYIVNLASGNLSSPLAPVIFPPGNPYGIAGR